MSYAQLRFIYGSLLGQTCEKIGLEPSRDNKEVIKAVLKKVTGIETLGRMQDDDDVTYNSRLTLFIERSAIFLASELGIVVDLPGEENVEEADMRSFLRTIYG